MFYPFFGWGVMNKKSGGNLNLATFRSLFSRIRVWAPQITATKPASGVVNLEMDGWHFEAVKPQMGLLRPIFRCELLVSRSLVQIPKHLTRYDWSTINSSTLCVAFLANWTRWWFQLLFSFIPYGGNDPIWLIFFRLKHPTSFGGLQILVRKMQIIILYVMVRNGWLKECTVVFLQNSWTMLNGVYIFPVYIHVPLEVSKWVITYLYTGYIGDITRLQTSNGTSK